MNIKELIISTTSREIADNFHLSSIATVADHIENLKNKEFITLGKL